MTRENILTVAQFYKGSSSFTRFKSCQAWVSDVIFCSAIGSTFQLVKSYNTIVAVADLDNDIYYELGKWSRTTSKQVTQIYNRDFAGFDRVLIQITTEERQKL